MYPKVLLEISEMHPYEFFDYLYSYFYLNPKY